MFDLSNCGLVRPWTDPETRVTSYILDRRVAPYQQSFYFVNRSMTDDGRYLWFHCISPPARHMLYGASLGVWDIEQGTVNRYPETQFLDASPLVDTRSGEST